ncbi:MAG: hypothetical protein AB7G93_19490 [Bdellovibrionales bacterium]
MGGHVAPLDEECAGSPWAQLSRSLNHLSGLLSHQGIHKSPFAEEDRHRFRELPTEVQLQIWRRFERYSRVYFVAAAKMIPFADSRRMLNLFLSLNHLRFPGEFETYLKSGAVEEIYDADLVQEYGNVEFLQLCNYPLLKIFLVPFPNLYLRDPAITQQIVSHCLHVLKNGGGFEPFSVPKHMMREISSERKVFFEIENIAACSLLDAEGEPTHFFSNQWARIEPTRKVEIIY